ncbi:hypothetical protein DL770_011188 [Monosporascus sp. CRB-9-2]|nr:hypothetical protein DL770_011188 [Monosporascus sp. CRB-9-2]
MEHLDFQFTGGAPAGRRAYAGVVGSGDLEVLLTPGTAGQIDVAITTSVNGMSATWQAQLAREAMSRNPIERDSFIERDARRRAIALLDPGTFRELLDPFEQLTSPWLPRQGIVTQADDGVVVARGTLGGQPAVVLAIEGAFQGGSMGEVSGAKIAGALELAVEDNRNGIPTRAVIVFETGGVRLQEANLGLAAIAEIHAGIRALREPVQLPADDA